MLRSNCKAANKNIRQYILDNFHPEGYTLGVPKPNGLQGNYTIDQFKDVACFIMTTFETEKRYSFNAFTHQGYYKAFVDWCQGLPCVLDCGYYYNREARHELGNLLEMTCDERYAYDETTAEKYLTSLLFRELVKGCGG